MSNLDNIHSNWDFARKMKDILSEYHYGFEPKDGYFSYRSWNNGQKIHDEEWKCENGNWTNMKEDACGCSVEKQTNCGPDCVCKEDKMKENRCNCEDCRCWDDELKVREMQAKEPAKEPNFTWSDYFKNYDNMIGEIFQDFDKTFDGFFGKKLNESNHETEKFSGNNLSDSDCDKIINGLGLKNTSESEEPFYHNHVDKLLYELSGKKTTQSEEKKLGEELKLARKTRDTLTGLKYLIDSSRRLGNTHTLINAAKAVSGMVIVINEDAAKYLRQEYNYEHIFGLSSLSNLRVRKPQALFIDNSVFGVL